MPTAALACIEFQIEHWNDVDDGTGKACLAAYSESNWTISEVIKCRILFLREQLVGLLGGGEAHIKTEKALDGISANLRNVRPLPDAHSIWEELEHLRIAQEDILRYTLDPEWKSPAWPDGYWP